MMERMYEPAGSALELIGRTPLVHLARLQQQAHSPCVLYGKLESANPGGSVKDRIALSMIEAAEQEGQLQPGDLVVEATSGNTGIGLAMVCALKGYRLILTMPEDMSVERRSIFLWYGAECRLTPAIEGMSGAVYAAEQLAREGAFWPRQFENRHNPEIHALTTGPEIWQQCRGRVDLLVAGVGTGGTLTGTARYLKEKNPELKVVAVEPARSPVLSGGRPGLHRIDGLGAGFIPGVLERGLIDRVEAVDDVDAYRTARELARQEGLLVGPSSGAAVAAALRLNVRELCRPEIEKPVIAIILPDSGSRYLSEMTRWSENLG